MTPSQIEDTIRAAAALTAAIAARNPDDAAALLGPGPAWCLALWLADALESSGTDPAGFAAGIIADSVAFEAGQAAA
jgi:hypothetical protein